LELSGWPGAVRFCRTRVKFQICVKRCEKSERQSCEGSRRTGYPSYCIAHCASFMQVIRTERALASETPNFSNRQGPFVHEVEPRGATAVHLAVVPAKAGTQ